MENYTIEHLRNELKKAGFNVSTRYNRTFGKYAARIFYKNPLTKEKINMPTIFTKQTLAFWQPAIEIKDKYVKKIKDTVIL